MTVYFIAKHRFPPINDNPSEELYAFYRATQHADGSGFEMINGIMVPDLESLAYQMARATWFNITPGEQITTFPSPVLGYNTGDDNDSLRLPVSEEDILKFASTYRKKLKERYDAEGKIKNQIPLTQQFL
jgi:hypothetical protein